MAPRLKDKVALIAGAGSVVPGGWSNGKATGVLFAREGAKVFAVDLTLEAAEETAAAIRREGGTCTPFAADLSRASDVKAMTAACLAACGGRIDVLFNNVGLRALGGPEEVSEADWDRLMTVNVKPMYLACREVLPVMVRQGAGSIVDNSSLASRRFPDLAERGRLGFRLDTHGGRFVEGLDTAASYAVLDRHVPHAIRTYRSETELRWLVGTG
ncbi:MAG TPA: SDR family NAD(P)-dependent oxidoreductase, partial [Geminicoccaceae bacterium]|nr:SDR family NAD(P)-dependent oxidoreductase [Geminicoccaceae bacterium]